MQALADVKPMELRVRRKEDRDVEGDARCGDASNKMMGKNVSRGAPLRPRMADGDELVRRRALVPVQHRAVVLAVAAAARWKAGVGILPKCEQRRKQREREGREQQDGEQASHETGMRLVYDARTNSGSIGFRCGYHAVRASRFVADSNLSREARWSCGVRVFCMRVWQRSL